MKDLSGVNLCVWIEILRIIKNLVSLPLFCCTCILISVCNDRVFDTGTNGVADGFVKDYLEWVMLLGIS